MALAQFFHDGVLEQGADLWLDEDTARHLVQVLRMGPGERVALTNGQGYAAIADIAVSEKKKCKVKLGTVTFHEKKQAGLHLCMGFTKSSSRNEWMLEKATELGVQSIIPLLTARTEREYLRYDRMRNILVSALLQSQQYYLPELSEPLSLKEVVKRYEGVEQKLIGHCIDSIARSTLAEMLKPGKETVILIGPEGDFTEEEVNLCTAAQYAGVTMGMQRLRTETAAMSVCAYFNLVNNA